VASCEGAEGSDMVTSLDTLSAKPPSIGNLVNRARVLGGYQGLAALLDSDPLGVEVVHIVVEHPLEAFDEFRVTDRLGDVVGELAGGVPDAISSGFGEPGLDHHRAGRKTQVVGEVGAPAKGGLDLVQELAGQLAHQFEVQAVGEDDHLGSRVDPECLVEGDHLEAVVLGVSRVLTGTLPVARHLLREVTEEGVGAEGVGQCDGETFTEGIPPQIEQLTLDASQGGIRILSGHTQCGHDHDELVGVGAHGKQREVHSCLHVGGAKELLGELFGHSLIDVPLPGTVEATTCAEVAEHQVRVVLTKECDLLVKPADTLSHGGFSIHARHGTQGVARAHAVDERQGRDFPVHAPTPVPTKRQIELPIHNTQVVARTL